jgi:hypothetical protein
MERDLAEILPIMAIEHDCILSKQGDITIVFKAELPEAFTLSDEDYENLHQSFIKAVKVLSAGTVLHKQDWFVRKTYQPETGENTSFLSESSNRYFGPLPFTA